MVAALRTILILACALTVTACARAHADPKVVAQGEAFLVHNKTAPGVVTTASGLQYKILSSGPAAGAKPKASDEVKVNYEGTLLDGTVFDSSYQRGTPAVFGVSGLIPAWTEALQLMRPGDVWEIYAPAGLAYGDEGAGPIPPGSVLKFKLELIRIAPPGAQ